MVWIPLTAAGVINGIFGTLKLNFCYREFMADLMTPGPWLPGSPTTGLLIPDASISADGDYNSGNMPITPAASKAFLQVGVMIPANDARATADLTLAVKY